MGSAPARIEEVAGHGLDLRRRICRGYYVGRTTGRLAPGAARCCGRVHELSPGSVWVLRSSGTCPGVGAQLCRKLWADGSAGSIEVGARQHCRVRRRSGERHDFWGKRWIVFGKCADGFAALKRIVPEGNWGEWSGISQRRPFFRVTGFARRQRCEDDEGEAGG